MNDAAPVLKIKLQVYCGGEIAMGPGKADLLEAIRRDRSISAAGRALGMSYRRAWLLVDTMNRCWSEPLVSTSPGAAQGAGARVTPFGETVLAHYRALQVNAEQAATGVDWAKLSAALRDIPLVHQQREG